MEGHTVAAGRDPSRGTHEDEDRHRMRWRRAGERLGSFVSTRCLCGDGFELTRRKTQVEDTDLQHVPRSIRCANVHWTGLCEQSYIADQRGDDSVPRHDAAPATELGSQLRPRRRQPMLWGQVAVSMMTLLAVAVSAAAPDSVATPELRFGTVQWEQVGPNAILFKIETAWTPLSNPARETDTLYCVPKLTLPYSCRNMNEPPTVGATLAMRTPTHTNTSNRWLFGDEAVTLRANGTALQGMKVVEDTSARADGRGFLKTYTQVLHEYPEPGVYHAALTGCCRSWDKLLNHRGYGWNLTTTVVVDSLWEPIAGLPPSKGGPYSPRVPYTPEVLVQQGVSAAFYIKAVDHLRSDAPSLCQPSSSGPDAVTSGCRFRYALGSTHDTGFNLSFPVYAARLSQHSSLTEGTTDLGFPFGLYRPKYFSERSAPGIDPLPPDISIDPVTGLVTIPASVSSDIVIASPSDYSVLSFVVRITASQVPRPDSRALRDPGGGTHTPAITVSLDFMVVVQGKPVPWVSLPARVSALDFIAGVEDASTGPYVDFFCDYHTAYALNSSAGARMLTPADGLNYTALGDASNEGRYLQLPHRPEANGHVFVNLSWSPPCSAVGLYPACVVSCTGTDALTAICSPPACFRMEVRGDCLQVRTHHHPYLKPLPPPIPPPPLHLEP
jgi:hypothetical protein